MNRILILGAGRSSGYLIEYLLEWSSSNGYELDIADRFTDQILPLLKNHPSARALNCDINNPEQRRSVIRGCTIVISMLPAFMHILVAEDCLAEGVSMATASYESDDLRNLRPEIEAKGLQFLNECGLDPGIDHMSAMQVIHRLENDGYTITGFKSFCGGLIAKGSNDNPWGYKFSWNPRNVILAGSGTARFLENGKLKFTPYSRLFSDPLSVSFINGDVYDGYPNRDSVGYQAIYGLENIDTMIRGTLRESGYCRAWNIMVQLGLTDDSYAFPLKKGMTYREFTTAFLPTIAGDEKDAIRHAVNPKPDTHALELFFWTGLLSDEEIPLKEGTPAIILQNLLETKWKLLPEDKDLVVMQHQFDAVSVSTTKHITSSLQVEGINSSHTAMAKTVGIPLAIGVKMLLEKKYTRPGLILPVVPEFYEPVLKELGSRYAIRFEEHETVELKT